MASAEEEELIPLVSQRHPCNVSLPYKLASEGGLAARGVDGRDFALSSEGCSLELDTTLFLRTTTTIIDSSE